MKTQSFTEFNLPQNAYTTFDATTLKSLIINRLNSTGVFTDQNFEGSNINAFIDVVSYMYHVLLFYLNTTSSETTFTTAQLYENINKLVSNINYKPIGKQTSLVSVSLSGTGALSQGFFTIPRFSFIAKNGLNFTTINDISFEKTIAGVQPLSIDNNILYQGTISPHPIIAATGEEFETVTIVNRKTDTTRVNVNIAKFIADNSFTIFIKDSETERWEEWQETASLYLESSTATKYEKRLNEYGNFEFKFGNGISGKKLKQGDSIQIYYVVSDNNSGQISSGVLFNSTFVLYDSTIFREIVADIYPADTLFLTSSQIGGVIANNSNDSTTVVDEESVEEIRNNAPKIFSLQNRLVTQTDYESFINRNFSSIIKSVKVLSNNEFTSDYLKYFYSIGLNKPNTDARVLLNQVNYSNSTMFNNVYIFCVPDIVQSANGCIPNYLNSTQKQLIINECNSHKDVTHNVVPIDPVYKAIDIGVAATQETPCLDLKDKTVLVVKKSRNSSINTTALKTSIYNLFKEAFSSLLLGSTVDISKLSNDILNTTGVDSIATRRVDTGYEVPLLSFVIWNPAYENEDIQISSQNIKLKAFEFAYFYQLENLLSKVVVETL
jgi:DNA-dependent RNA polymerase auxiliary subunit epsilon